jgi:hypothetical protein
MCRQPEQCAHLSQRSIERSQWLTIGARNHFLQRLDEYGSAACESPMAPCFHRRRFCLERCPHLKTRLMRMHLLRCLLSETTSDKHSIALQHCAWSLCHVCYHCTATSIHSVIFGVTSTCLVYFYLRWGPNLPQPIAAATR